MVVFFAPIKASREIQQGPVSREGAKPIRWFISARLYLQLYYFQKVNSSKVPIEGCDLYNLVA
jgi:hypothetical protein